MNRLLAALFALVLVCPALAQSDLAKFVSKANKMLEVDDFDGLAKLVKERQELALQYFTSLCWEQVRNEDEKGAYAIETMKTAWSNALETETLELLERYTIRRPYKTKNELAGVEKFEPEVRDLFQEGREKRDRNLFIVARDKAMELARHYEHLGHPLHAARMWSLASQIARGIPDIELEERRDAVYFMGNFLRLREEWSWTTDERYKSNKTWHAEQLKRIAEAEEAAAERQREGYDPSVTGIEALVMPNAEEEIAPLEFKVMKKDHKSPFAFGGAIPPLWLQATLQSGTGPGRFLYFRGKNLYLVRPSPTKFGVTIDGTETDLDKNPWEEISPSAKFKPTKFYLGPNKTEPYALWFFIGGSSEAVHGFNHNLEPAEHAMVYYKNAASWETTLLGETVTLYDDNSNGTLFDADPMEYGLLDRTRPVPGAQGAPIPAYDSMKVGKGKLQPWSNFAKIGDSWVHLRPHEDGKKLGARVVNPKYFKVGKVRLKWTGSKSAKPEVLVIQGRDLQEARFDISAAKEMEVPIGMYEVSFGRIASGKGSRALEAHIYPGSMEPFEVTDGKTTEVVLGGPFRLDFDRQGDGARVEIDSMNIAVIGVSGERYSRIHGAVPVPEVLAAKTPDGKGAKAIGSFIPMDLELLMQLRDRHPTYGLELGYFCVPKGSQGRTTVLKVDLPGEDYQVGLREKKNKLFGKLEPIYK